VVELRINTLIMFKMLMLFTAYYILRTVVSALWGVIYAILAITFRRYLIARL
jgi:hypothetical protein